MVAAFAVGNGDIFIPENGDLRVPSVGGLGVLDGAAIAVGKGGSALSETNAASSCSDEVIAGFTPPNSIWVGSACDSGVFVDSGVKSGSLSSSPSSDRD